jgi:hypothetical protein
MINFQIPDVWRKSAHSVRIMTGVYGSSNALGPPVALKQRLGRWWTLIVDAERDFDVRAKILTFSAL